MGIDRQRECHANMEADGIPMWLRRLRITAVAGVQSLAWELTHTVSVPKKKKKMEVEIGLMLLYAEECLELEDTGSVRKNCALEALERTLVLPTP